MRRRIFWVVGAGATTCLVGILLAVHDFQHRRLEAAYWLLRSQIMGHLDFPAGSLGPLISDQQVREYAGPDGLGLLLATEERLGKVGQALGAYLRDYGGLPDTLAELAEKGYINEGTTVNPATGEAFPYRKPPPVVVISSLVAQVYLVHLSVDESGRFLVSRAQGLDLR